MLTSVFVLLPEFQLTPGLFHASFSAKNEVIDIIHITEQQPEKAKPVLPAIPIPTDDPESLANIPVEYDIVSFVPTDVTVNDDIPEPFSIFVEYSTPPSPVNGYHALAANIEYPPLAKLAGVEGKVVVAAYINELGEILDTRIYGGLNGTGLNQAALEAVRKTAWNPAYQREEPVAVWINIPITFSLRK